MANKDPNYIPQLEKAISQKYGHEATSNPQGAWNEEKKKNIFGNRSKNVKSLLNWQIAKTK